MRLDVNKHFLDRLEHDELSSQRRRAWLVTGLGCSHVATVRGRLVPLVALRSLVFNIFVRGKKGRRRFPYRTDPHNRRRRFTRTAVGTRSVRL